MFKKRQLCFLQCTQCNFVFLQEDPNPNFENNIADFEPAYLHYLAPGIADQKNHDSILRWMNQYKPLRGQRFLDIGCGGGKFVNYLNQQGITAMGIEPSVTLYDHFLADKPSFMCTTVHEYVKNNAGKKFDILSALDVLEHVKDPVGFLSDISVLMHTDSLLFISTPDAGSMHKKIAGKRWHYFNRYHFSYFSPKTVVDAASKAGLDIINVSYRSRYFAISYLLQYFNNFLLQKKYSSYAMQKKWVIPLNLFDNMYCVLKKHK